MANFIGMVFATLQKEGVDTKGMSTDEAVKKFNEIKGKSGGDKKDKKELTAKEAKRLKELGVEDNKPQINKDLDNAKGAVRDYSTALSVAESRLKKEPGNKALQGRVSALRRDLKHYQSIVDEYENK